MVEVGKKVPDFCCLDEAGERVDSSSLLGQQWVLYFYPKDLTPGCTLEACQFSKVIQEFKKRGVAILGVSADSQERHQKFKKKYELAFPLLVDEDHAIAEAYGVYVEKSMFGRSYMGIERSTFLVNEHGCLVRIWRKVKVKGYVAEVLSSVGG